MTQGRVRRMVDAAAEFFRRSRRAMDAEPVVPSLRVFFDVRERREVLDRVAEALASGMLTQGRNLMEFEQVAQSWTGHPAVAVSSGTAALEAAFHTLGVVGRTVLVPANTFFATASAAMRAGARVVPVDIELDGLGMDPEALREQFAACDDVAAVAVVHLAGVVSPALPSVLDQCRTRGVPVVEDAAHALGSRLDGALAGSFGRFGAFSLHPAKVATSGEGGLVSAAADADRSAVRRLRDHGKVRPDRNVHDILGSNWRMSELHASVGIVHLGRLGDMLAERRELAAWYDEHLDAVPRIRRYPVPSASASNYYKYVVFLDPGVDRGELKTRLRQRHGVALSGEVYDLPLPDQPYFAGQFASQSFPRSRWFTERHLCLPVYPSLTTRQQWRVIDALRTELH